MFGPDEAVFVAEMFFEEIEYHVSGLRIERGIHRHLAKEIFQPGNDHRECAQAVPKIVEGKEALAQTAGALVFEGDEGAAQLDGVAHIVADEGVGKLEHVSRGQSRLSVVVELYFIARQKAVSAQNLFIVRAPHDELIIGVLTRVELVEVECQTGASASGSEGNLPEAAYLTHHIRRLLIGHDVNLVVALVGRAQTALGSQFGLKQFPTDGADDFFHF